MTSVQSQKITTFLWYDHGKALEAAQFYVSVFQDSPDTRILSENPMVVTFALAGQEYYALNGGPQAKFTHATSLYVKCEDQAEIDRLHAGLVTDGGGKDSSCGWLTDRYGLSWQLVPRVLGELMKDPDKEKRDRTMRALWGMKGKLDIETLKKAHEGK